MVFDAFRTKDATRREIPYKNKNGPDFFRRRSQSEKGAWFNKNITYIKSADCFWRCMNDYLCYSDKKEFLSNDENKVY